ncbi:hypothetical protein F8M41_019034 [Gigaspora margarita]|uniref:Uncharacterized protein n=1 Tax=Gigaspora margarita TaxID=4874 RepID=A0A8H3ZZJ0_GIGMA|nr:hypothetical protein F8M41_019034 [Gigaspora margarita]
MDQLTSSGTNKLSNNYQKGICIEKDEHKTFELYFKDYEMGNAAGMRAMLEIVIIMESELKGISLRHYQERSMKYEVYGLQAS